MTNTNKTATENTELARAELYWDGQDPNAEPGWSLRVVFESNGNEETWAIEGDEDASLNDLELATEIVCDGYSGHVRIFRAEQVVYKWDLQGAPSETERVALDAKAEGRHTEAKAIADAISAEAGRSNISDELRAGLDRYDACITALGGYGRRIRATTPDGALHEGALIELGFGGCQPGLRDDTGARYAIKLDAVLGVSEIGSRS